MLVSSTARAVGAPWNVVALREVPEVPAPKAPVEGLRAIYFKGPMYQGKPTRIFAYFGTPKGSPGKKYPAVVLEMFRDPKVISQLTGAAHDVGIKVLMSSHDSPRLRRRRRSSRAFSASKRWAPLSQFAKQNEAGEFYQIGLGSAPCVVFAICFVERYR